MATLTVTIPAGSYPAEVLRQAARRLEQAVNQIPDNVSNGGSTVVTIDNAPAGGGVVSFQVTAGPYQGNKFTA